MARTHKLTEGQLEAVRRLYATGDYPQRKLAGLYDVSQPTISRIVRGITRAQFPDGTSRCTVCRRVVIRGAGRWWE